MKIVRLLLLLSALVLGGCAPLTPPTASLTMSRTPAATQLEPKGTIRVGFSSTTDVGDIPSYMAHELLTAQGYTIERTPFAGADLQTAALVQGDLDFANGSMRTVWLALGQRPGAFTLMEQVRNDWLLVAEPEVKSCAELEGQRIAFTNNSSLNRALFDAHTQAHCPDLAFEQLFISSSQNRAAALMAGEVDATPLNLADWIRVQQQEPDRFHVLVDYAEELAELKTTGVHVNRAFAEQQPQAVRDYIRALLTVHRALEADPTSLQDAIVKYVKIDPDTARSITQEYLARGRWDVNGGLGRDDVQYSIDFFTKSGSIPKGLTVEGVSDLSYLDSVLEEMGRK